jgi:alpha-tubulin suppressor-like RCC1 family protein
VAVSGSLNLAQITAGGTSACALSSTSVAYCWGAGGSGQLGNGSTTAAQSTPVAVTATGVLSGQTLTQITAGTGFTCALASTGAAYCWGLNSSGQLGNTATAVSFSVPVAVTPQATMITTGFSHSCLLRNGKAYCWGDDTVGELGNNTTTATAQSTPVAVYTGGVLSGLTLIQISAGDDWTCALASTGNAYCWGNNDSGGITALGNGLTLASDQPVLVSGGLIFTQISVGSSFACGLTSAGVAYCWGNNMQGMLGNGGTGFATIPTAVTTSGVLSGLILTQINAGQNFTCALASTGAAYCWGSNSNGQLGNNSTTSSSVPVAVTTSGGLAGVIVTQLATGTADTCALGSAGAAYCWGLNTNGQLGNNSTTQSLVPVAVTTTGTPLAEITAGTSFACALDITGAAYCWGLNTNGQLGNNSTTQSLVPVPVTTTGVLAGATLTQIDAGQNFACVRDSTGVFYCWGGNATGQLGNGTTTQSTVPVIVAGVVPGPPTSVAAFPGDTTANVYWVAPASLGTGTLTGYTATASPGGATCTTAGATTCTIAGLTNGTTYSITVVTDTTDGNSTASAVATVTPWPPRIIAAGNENSCTIQGGKAYCWGDNTYGELGNNTTKSSNTAVAVYTGGALSGVTLTQIATGYQHTCALASTGLVYCWGYGIDGELGNGGNANSDVPVPVTASGALSGVTVTQISAGQYHTCALGSNGLAYCWGLNTQGQLGIGSTTSSSTPVAVTTTLGTGALSGKTLTRIAAGATSTCVLASTGLAYCWGDDTYGQLGDSITTATPQTTPVAVTAATGALSGKTLVRIQGGYLHYCALDSTGLAYCWGYGLDGELGNSTTTSSNVAVPVTASGALSGKTLVQLTAGQSHTCALDSAGTAYCWGLNTSGQLGNNSVTSPQTTPALVYTAGVLSGKTIAQLSAGRAHTCAMDTTGTAYCWGLNANGQVGDDSITQRNAAVLVAPQAPTGVTAVPGDTTAAVSWTAPVYLNNGTLTGYTVTASPGTETCTTTGATSCTVIGLTDGTTYTITVTATATTGTSAPSIATTVEPVGFLSISVQPAATLPSTAPGTTTSAQLGTVTVTDNRALVSASWTAVVSSTTFTTGVGSPALTIPTTDVTYWSGSATATSGTGTFTPGQSTSAGKQGLSVSRTAFTLTAGAGVNSASWNPTLGVTVPASAVAGSYTGTVTHSVS